MKSVHTSFGFALLLCSTASAITVTPSDLSPGSKYHLAFVTDGSMDATSASIADYNAFVQAQAANVGLDVIHGNPVTWRAVASTSSVHARDNIGVVDDPIYRLDDHRIANHETDLFDGTLETFTFNITQYGQAANAFVWTGSNLLGMGYNAFRLGDAVTVYGRSSTNNTLWITDSQQGSSIALPLYAISSELTVPGTAQANGMPEPASAGLLLLAGAGLLRRRRPGAIH